MGTDLALLVNVRALMLWLLLLGGGGQVVLRGRDARGCWFDLSSLRGRTVVITFASRHTERPARAVNDELSAGHMVVSVVDLRGVPAIAHKLALQKIRESDRPGHLRHIVDKDGEIARGFGADTRHHVEMLVVDRRGRLVGRWAGPEQLPEVEAQLRQISAPRRARR